MSTTFVFGSILRICHLFKYTAIAVLPVQDQVQG